MMIREFLRANTASGARTVASDSRWGVRGEISQGLLKGLAIAAGVLVVGVIVYYNTAGAKPYGVTDKYHYLCSECGREFIMTEEEITNVKVAANDPTKHIMPCPKCGKEAGRIMVQCEKCGHWFKPKGDNNACPKCGYDPYKADDSKPESDK